MAVRSSGSKVATNAPRAALNARRTLPLIKRSAAPLSIVARCRLAGYRNACHACCA